MAEDTSKSLKGALSESLTAILSCDQTVRTSGEEQVKALEVTEEFGVHLAEFTVDPNGQLAIRQLASVLLKQYVEAHWAQQSEKFRPPETSDMGSDGDGVTSIDSAKAAIRQILPIGLTESLSKVRTSVAYAISAIAQWDWPEVWPELFSILMQALTSGNPDAVHGAMRVLSEFSQNVTDTQMSQVAPVILPEMYKIFTQFEVYSIRTRSRAVSIFTTCTSIIVMMTEIHKTAVKELLSPVLPQFIEAFIQSIQASDGLTSDSGLRMEVVKALTVLVKNCPKLLSQWLPQILPPVWEIFTTSIDVYVKTVINDLEEASDPVDSDGDILGFENLVYSVFEFISALIETSRFRSTIKKSVNEILYYIIQYMQITHDQERLWLASPDQFVEDEDDDTFSYSVRISAQDLLLSLCTEFKWESSAGLCEAVTKHLHYSEMLKNASNPHWWKLHEACMLALGSVKSAIIEGLKNGKVKFELPSFLHSVVLEDLNNSVSPFLAGRSLWTGSQYTEVMTPELLERFLQGTVSGLHPSQHPCVRICAVRAVYGFCVHLKQSENTQMLTVCLANIMEGLVNIAQQFSSDVLALCMETIAVVLSVDKPITATFESKITPLTIAIFLKYTSDPLIVSLTQDIFKELSENESCRDPVQQRLVPTLVSILQSAPDKVPTGLPPVALDVLETLIRSGGAPISDLLITSAFPSVVHCTLNTDDNSAMQNGGECLRAFASVGFDQVVAWTDNHGRNGLYYIIQVISRLLDPKTSEGTASFVGRLISVVIGRVGDHLGDDLDLILRAVLSKMQQADSLSVIQSLVMVFAHLLHSQLEPVLNFLSTVPGPTGKPALEFVLDEWCSRQHLFFGNYDGKISSVALGKLLQHTITNNDVRLQNIEVKGDEITPQTNGMRTRAKVAQEPVQWTQIPVVVKIYKLLISELSHQIEKSENQADVEAELTDDEEQEFEIDDDAEIEDLGIFDLYDDECEADDDPDALDDPINQINLKTYLTELLQSLSQLPCYSIFTAHHTEAEQQILKSIGINV